MSSLGDSCANLAILVDGRHYTFEVEPSDTVECIATKVQEESDIPPAKQRFVFAGKQLESSRTLDYYGIGRGSTLHLTLRSKDERTPVLLPSYVPRESLFPTGPEAHMKVREWKALADHGSFDADTHIVDPQAHYTALDSVEHTVVTSSEFYRHSGVYRLGNPGEAAELQHLTRISTAPGWVNNLVLNLQKDGDSGASGTVASLCETYFIILSALDNFELLKSRRFCTSFFSILVERSDGTVAEIVKIHRDILFELKSSLEVAIDVAHEERADPEIAYGALMDCVGPVVQVFLDILGFPQLRTDMPVVNTTPEMLNICRMVACILDLGLVCYVGSHGARFDTEYFRRNMDPLTFDLGNKLSFDCSLRNLACLDRFLDAKLVWVFRAGLNLAPALPRGKTQKKLSILTTIDALADVWGPVWAEAADHGIAGQKPTRIKKYHVSKGVIRRVREGAGPTVLGAVKCHWYGWTQDYRLRFSSLFTKTEDLSMALDDKLLIGSDIRANPGCTYTLQEYEMNYSDMISSLGPKPSTWKLDGAAVALQLAAPKVIAFQIQGNVKKIPETTVKQFIWERWSFEPDRANPGILNNYFGVEISHCTGNARRIPLKQIFLMEPIQELLERQIPKWSSTQWGTAFQEALQAESNDAIFQFWNKHTTERPLIGQLVRCVLDMLDSTGRTDIGFRAAFVHQNRELGVDLDIDNNEWAGLLKDSYLMATYAVISGVCLECRRPDHTTSICGDESRYTVFQTQIGLKRGSNLNERLKIEPHSQTYKKVSDEEVVSGSYFITPESSVKRTFLMNYYLAVAKELLYHYSYNLNERTARVVLRASGRSFGGMSYKRDRTTLGCASGDVVDEVDNTAATQEALTQVEIEAILKDEMQTQQTQRSGNYKAKAMFDNFFLSGRLRQVGAQKKPPGAT